MTTIVQLTFKCLSCENVFLGTVLGSMGYRSTDQQLCREYWGLNPMPYFLTVCPHCNHVNWSSEFEQLDEKPDDSLLKAEYSCESFEKYIQGLIDSDAEPSMIAYVSQQSGCCRRINGDNPLEQFQRAAKYFQKAKDEGAKEFGGLGIDEWIERMEDSRKN